MLANAELSGIYIPKCVETIHLPPKPLGHGEDIVQTTTLNVACLKAGVV